MFNDTKQNNLSMPRATFVAVVYTIPRARARAHTRVHMQRHMRYVYMDARMHAYIHPHYAFMRYEEANYRDIPQASLAAFWIKANETYFHRRRSFFARYAR